MDLPDHRSCCAFGRSVFCGSLHSSTTTDAFRSPTKSIAILPFENLSRDPDNVYFAEGVHDGILTNLGVANVLEGSVQRFGNRVRVSAQLVDARSQR